MKKIIIFLAVLICAVFLTNCAVPSYSVPTYVGSLDKCLDIYGTYEIVSLPKSTGTPDFSGLILPNTYIKNRAAQIGTSNTAGKRKFIKKWVHFTKVNSNVINIQEFNEEGKEINMNIDMREEGLGFSCNGNSWVTSRSTRSTNDFGNKSISYIKIKVKTDKEIAVDYDTQSWGAGSIYHEYI